MDNAILTYVAQYRYSTRWVQFTVLNAENIYHARDLARDIVGSDVGLAVGSIRKLEY